MPNDNTPTPKVTPTPTGDDEELTPAEEKKFGKFLNKFLEEDETLTTTATHTPTPTPSGSAPTLNIGEEINKALDAREGKKAKDDEIGKLRADVDSLKPKPKRWHQPWTLFSG